MAVEWCALKEAGGCTDGLKQCDRTESARHTRRRLVSRGLEPCRNQISLRCWSLCFELVTRLRHTSLTHRSQENAPVNDVWLYVPLRLDQSTS